ncbi:uncharacterized protein APUU_71122S [Aspergillus puulaauensis]|uniref:Uncharacterized protein n=1 Tax=Aspergillus puulaauensis TaxID=1220207 RepID=A0A7R7XY06_9EURO|nr:uncharacterized protein APUU_71122S [Aspergillus puulaauensis]BCS29552.1 hypothetical protein APUU_71122S [Aspergillus puulaauensis]
MGIGYSTREPTVHSHQSLTDWDCSRCDAQFSRFQKRSPVSPVSSPQTGLEQVSIVVVTSDHLSSRRVRLRTAGSRERRKGEGEGERKWKTCLAWYCLFVSCLFVGITMGEFLGCVPSPSEARPPQLTAVGLSLQRLHAIRCAGSG